MNISLEHLKVVGSSPTSGSIPEVLLTESFFHFCFCCGGLGEEFFLMFADIFESFGDCATVSEEAE